MVTHGHPDHYFGTAVLTRRFPGTPVYATPETIAEIARTVATKVDTWTPVYGAAEIPTVAELPAIKPLPARPLSVDGQRVEVRGVFQGDVLQESNSAVWIPSTRTLVAGDLVYNQTHVWLAESNQQSRRGWLRTLRVLRGWAPAVVVAGHKNSADLPDSPGSLSYTSRYIQHFEATRASSTDADGLVATMTALYPDSGLPIILQLAAEAAYAG